MIDSTLTKRSVPSRLVSSQLRAWDRTSFIVSHGRHYRHIFGCFSLCLIRVGTTAVVLMYTSLIITMFLGQNANEQTASVKKASPTPLLQVADQCRRNRPLEYPTTLYSLTKGRYAVGKMARLFLLTSETVSIQTFKGLGNYTLISCGT